MAVSRRRFLTLASAAALAIPSAGRAYRWQGTALGARAQIILDHPRAEAITGRALAEIARLEDIFSLYRPGSVLCRLNAEGSLPVPPPELLECLSIARRVHLATQGRFDPTIQPMWQLVAEAWAMGHPPEEADMGRARALVGFERVHFDSARTILAPGQALTLNGIAQGYIADRVAALMQREGIDDVLIDSGEISALGRWPISIAGTSRRVMLHDRALATSAPTGTVLDADGKVGHILDPSGNALRRPAIRSLSISAPSAALADALSTGLCLANGRAEVVAALGAFKHVHLAHLGFDQAETKEEES